MGSEPIVRFAKLIRFSNWLVLFLNLTNSHPFVPRVNSLNDYIEKNISFVVRRYRDRKGKEERPNDTIFF